MTLAEDWKKVAALKARMARYSGKMSQFFPDCLPTCHGEEDSGHLKPDGTQRMCRMLYRKHLQFFAAGAEHPERAFICANRQEYPWSGLRCVLSCPRRRCERCGWEALWGRDGAVGGPLWWPFVHLPR